MNWRKRWTKFSDFAVFQSFRADADAERSHSAAAAAYGFANATVRIAAVGDVHGRVDLLRRVAERLDAFAEDTSKRLVEVYLGDYVDRGADSRGVLDFLIDRSRLKDREVVCLAGNHEEMLLKALDNDEDFIRWLFFGGDWTLLSYGVSPMDAKKSPTQARESFREALPPSHLDFMRELRPIYVNDNFVFVHAGIRPGISIEAQRPSDLMSIRAPFLNSALNSGFVVVHGHTPATAPVFRPNRIGIDTGAYCTGILTCLTIASEGVATFDTASNPTIAEDLTGR
jgi:serine/threonine protein phosphatase 1